MLRIHLTRQRVIVFVVFLLVTGLLTLIILINPPADTDKIYIHITIHGVPVGGMTLDGAIEALHDRYQPELTPLRIRYTLNGEEAAERGFEDFGARFDFTGVVEEALHYSQSRDLWRRIKRWLGRPYEITVPPLFLFDTAKVENEMRALGEKLHRPPVNARHSMENGRIIILPESAGQAIDVALAVEETASLLSQLTEGTVALTVRILPPRYTQADLDFTVSVLGSYRTPYNGGFNEARTRNIQRAARRIHNQVILPGEIFSAGTVIGAYLPNSGYEAALVLVNGEPMEDIGGGVCQVATTLYNAVLRAELSVVQRHNHSARVSYADFGFDATLAGDWYDLKFRNDSAFPILITTEVGGGRLYVALHGFEARPTDRTIRFTNERTKVAEPEPYREVTDATLEPGERVIMLEAITGYTYDVFKHVYINGNAVERVKVNTSTYRPLQGVMHVGRG
ncbi:MAG: VanW family protein [Defluviitaleaceae bacterium]|nr:VanW family protein [Defluviitaleaceae bacterium]